MNRCVLWVGPPGSRLPARLGQGLPAVLRSLPPGELRPFNPAVSGVAVLVVELRGHEHGLTPLRLTQLQRDGFMPWSLILLPARPRYSCIDWLDAGADRCLPVDSDLAVVEAMIRALLHRCHGQPATYTEHGVLRFEPDTKTLFHPGGRVALTCGEPRVADVLFQRGARHVRPEEIGQALRTDARLQRSPSLVSLYIHRINRKIRPYGLRIEFKRAYGYRLRLDAEDDARTERPDWPAHASAHALHSWWSAHANTHGPA